MIRSLGTRRHTRVEVPTEHCALAKHCRTQIPHQQVWEGDNDPAQGSNILTSPGVEQAGDPHQHLLSSYTCTYLSSFT